VVLLHNWLEHMLILLRSQFDHITSQDFFPLFYLYLSLQYIDNIAVQSPNMYAGWSIVLIMVFLLNSFVVSSAEF
jgi:hypothetical protein